MEERVKAVAVRVAVARERAAAVVVKAADPVEERAVEVKAMAAVAAG